MLHLHICLHYICAMYDLCLCVCVSFDILILIIDLLLGRKAMTNLDGILKSRDITLPTKVRLVKAMVFLVVMYGCESCTIKKSEHQRIYAFEPGVGEDS